MKCWKCGKGPLRKENIHHINFNDEDNSPINRIPLCPTCHDLIEGICTICQNMGVCHTRKFKDCWRYETNLPPIHFARTIGKENQVKSDIWNNRLNILTESGCFCTKCSLERTTLTMKRRLKPDLEEESVDAGFYNLVPCEKHSKKDVSTRRTARTARI